MFAWTTRGFGAVVRDARLRNHLTQAQLAGRIGTSRQWVIALERGKATAELGMALRAVSALGLVADIIDTPPTNAGVDLDRLLADGS